MVTLANLMDGCPSATKLMIQLAMSSFVQVGINPQDIIAFAPLWSPTGQFFLEVHTSDSCLLFLYRHGEVFLAKGENKENN